MVLCVFLPQLIIYVLGMPFLALTMLFLNRHHWRPLRSSIAGCIVCGLDLNDTIGFCGCFAKAALFSLSVVGSTGTNLTIQTHLAMLVLFGSISPSYWAPMKKNGCCLMYLVAGLVVCWILMWSGIVYYLDDIVVSRKDLATVCLVMLNVLYALSVGVVLLRQKALEAQDWPVFFRNRICCMVSDEALSCR